MTAARCAWWTALAMVTVWSWATSSPWWWAIPMLILLSGPLVAAYRDWEAEA